MYWIDYSVFMAFTFILLLNRILSNNYTTKEKIIFILFFLSVTGNLFLAIGRTGQVAFIVTIFVMMIIHFRFSLKAIFFSLILLASIFTSAYHFSNSFKMRSNSALQDIKQIKNMNLNGSWGIRVAYWITTFDIIKDNYLVGVGIGDYKRSTADIITKNNYTFLSENAKRFMGNNDPHNQYLLVLLQMGIVGLGLFLYMIYQILKLDIKVKELKELSILFVSVFFVSCFAESLFFNQFTISLFILFVGLFTAGTSSIDKLAQKTI
jgi:O-antigen ligase